MPCTPKQMINMHLEFDEAKVGKGNYRNNSHCDDECFRLDYLTKITTGNTDKQAMKYFINRTILEIDNSE